MLDMTNKYNGYFKDFTIDDFHAQHTDGRIYWVGNGFMFFRSESHAKSDAVGMSIIERYRLWTELRREVTRRRLAK